ncbi:MAG: hypothetical protein ACLFUB_04245 [Cyclobacteriaceae bacterium]
MKARSNSSLLLLHTPENVLAVNAFAAEQVQALYGKYHTHFAKDELPSYTIWIGREEELHVFVQHIPQLAWDMLEYAEEPLELIFPQKKYYPPFEDPYPGLSLRLVTQPKLQQVVRQHGPLITFRLKSSAAPLLKGQTDHTVDCREAGSPHDKVKTMKLFADESFTFMR